MSVESSTIRESVSRASPSQARAAGLILMSDVKQLLIAREPIGGVKVRKLYSVRTPDDSWSCSVESEDPCSFSWAWHIRFQTSRARLTIAELGLNRANFKFVGPTGEPLGRAREAWWSLFGKTYVEDEKGQTLGCLVGGRECRSADNTCLGIFDRDKSSPRPRPFRWRNMHLNYRSVWNRANPGPVDERLIYCYVCRMIQCEFINDSG